jgi:hypothetical protein
VNASSRCALLPALVALLLAAPAAGQGWPEVFEPTTLLTLHLQMDASDWTTVQNDTSLSIEVPATFWADGETPITISVRRKSADALTAASGYKKVSLRLDINDFVLGQSWHGLKKLSLENGDDNNVLSEGFGWHIHRLASGTLGYGYSAALASWVRVFINGVDTGVYVNPEFRDKKFLEHRGVFVEGQTWLYEVEAKNTASMELHVGGPQDSPTVEALCYEPFAPNGPTCPVPDLATHVPQYVDMAGLLGLLASDAFSVNPDATLTNGKNFYFADFSYGPRRMYFPWDLDSAAVQSATKSIYSPTRRGSDYSVLVEDPTIRAQYSQMVNDLVCGPWSIASLTSFLNAVEPMLAGAVDADPNNQLGESAAAYFDTLRGWATTRVTHVMGELENFQPCPTVQLRLNELMASNVAFLEDPDEPDEFPDWFEIFNPAAVSVDIGGVYLTDDPLTPTKYEIPAGVTIPGQGHLIFYADDDDEQGPAHTNFKLAGAGETLQIYDRDGVSLLDSIAFGPQTPEVAFARFPDGGGPWDFTPTATPGLPNAPHNPPPAISSTLRDVARPSAGEVVGVSSTVIDDSAVAGVSLHYDAGSGPAQVAMLDDGASGDGGPGDGVYGAQIPAHPDDTVVHYWVTASDDLGGVSQDPVPAPAVTFTYVVGYDPPPLVFNEFMADNDTVIEDPDEPLAFEDWVEIYNAGTQPVSLDGMYISDNFFVPTKFPLPAGLSVPAGGHLLLWADSEPLQGSTHLNFQLAAAGEQLGLYDTDARGNVPIDTLSFGPQGTDAATGRCPDGFWLVEPLSSPSPAAMNLEAPGCLGGSLALFEGLAQGGEVRLLVDGLLLVVATVAGQSAEDVARAVADAIAADATLAAGGVTASSLGPELATNGSIGAMEITDPGITSPGATQGPPPAAPVPALGRHALVLVFLLLLFGGLVGRQLARREARRCGGAT